MKHIVMLSTAIPGGMSEVVSSLRNSGLFQTFGIQLICTHDAGSILQRLGIFVRALGTFTSLLVRGRVSLVHAHVAMRGSFWRKAIFLWIARLFRVPIVVHLHGSQFESFYERECGPVRRALVRATFRQAAAVLVLSRKWHDYLRTVAPDARVEVVHNFVDPERLAVPVSNPAIERSANTILFLGELGRRKGIYDLIRAMPMIVARCPGARLVAGGTGESEQIAALARSLGVSEAIELPGWVAGNRKASLLAAAAVYALPSHNENFPVSILEAMAAGLPIVTTPVGGIPDMINDGVEGSLVQPGNVEALARAIGNLLADPGLRLVMGQAARRKVDERFTAREAIRAIDSIYRRAGAVARAQPSAVGGLQT